MHQPDFFHFFTSSIFTLHYSLFTLHCSLGRKAASAHARCSAQCGQCRCQDAHDDLNHRLPSLFLHNFSALSSNHISHFSSIISHLKELPTWGKLFSSH